MSDFSDYRRPFGHYAFHMTTQEAVPSIQKHGLLRNKNSDGGTTTIKRVLNQVGYEDQLPFDRSEVVYCDVDGTLIGETLEDDTPLTSNMVAVVIALDAIDAPMYLADMSIISDLIDYKYEGSELMTHANSPEEAAQLYQESIVKVRCAEDITSELASEHDYSELVIEGDIPPSAIVDICD